MKFWLAFLISAVTLISCKKMKEPEFIGIENVKMDGLGIRTSAVTLDIRYHNPNKFSGKLSNAEGHAWVDSVYLGHFIVDTSVAIPANAEFLVPVRLAVDMKQMLRHTLSTFRKEDVLLKITGRARAGRSGFYKNFSLNYLGRQNLSSLFANSTY